MPPTPTSTQIEPGAATPDGRILVFGATGTHGGAVAYALLGAGCPVTAFVRDPRSTRAQALERAGAQLVVGDLEDPASVSRGLEGIQAAYAVTTPFEGGPAAEIRQGEQIIAAATQVQLPWLILASVASAPDADVPHFKSAFLASGGYRVDIPALKQRYPEIPWTSFPEWAGAHDWHPAPPATPA